MSEAANSPQGQTAGKDGQHEGREAYDMDIDRMVNEGLGGGNVTLHNGRIGASTTDTMRPDVCDAEGHAKAERQEE